MRISTLGVFNRYLSNITKYQNKIERYSNELSSGKKIFQPSDAPVDNSRALQLKSLAKEIDGYMHNIDLASNSMSIAETSLKNVSEAALDARVDIVQLLNTGILDSEDANMFKDYLQNVRDYIISQSNVRIGSNYLFGGEDSKTVPFDKNGFYRGSSVEVSVPVAKATEVVTKFNGKNYLSTTQSGILGNEKQKIGLVKAIDDIIAIIEDGEIYKLHGKNSELGYASVNDALISSAETNGTVTINYNGTTISVNYDSDTADAINPSTLQELVDAINNDPANNGNIIAYTFTDKDGIERLGFTGKETNKDIKVTITGDLQNHLGSFKHVLNEFDEGFDGVDRHRGMIGVQEQLIDNLKEQHDNFKVNYNELASKFEDSDYAEAIVNLEKAKTTYQATLASFMQNKELSLLKYFTPS
ncbi:MULTISPECIES: flagellar hook-associated protein FlgL [unclassified Nitratiruptor]|uniref:flagellar hook-associated protein FlgL n=1 Tax=unclassified Nitratiruptor TaxID=2624044 RepID=UPI001915195E|nr:MULTISPECIES: flagellar hook-associated protein FlgL [unclassified Nitratiruptor]BCD59944.1 flagellar hook-associated protein 3 FlgL [Nitratiruptor sp. YY08-10]BCD63867.1 flagellar hook-associated protein 3 FlgL [Nitratiruptor sp. YY08-14]